jgi:sortase A
MQWLLNGEATGAVLTMTTCHPKFSHPRAPGRARVLESSVAKAESPDGPAALEGL